MSYSALTRQSSRSMFLRGDTRCSFHRNSPEGKGNASKWATAFSLFPVKLFILLFRSIIGFIFKSYSKGSQIIYFKATAFTLSVPYAKIQDGNVHFDP